jgi:hypothetical protein
VSVEILAIRETIASVRLSEEEVLVVGDINGG